jgi:hypothetical protein
LQLHAPDQILQQLCKIFVTYYITTHLEALVGHPDRAVTLKAAAKAELPDFISLADTLEGLNVGQHIPAAARV